MIVHTTTAEASRLAPTFDRTQPDIEYSPEVFQICEQTKWGWACRSLDPRGNYFRPDDEQLPPRVGDVAVVELEVVKHHSRIVTSSHDRMRLYSGDQIVGVFGNRYATDAFEAEVRTADEIHILTSAGMLGTVISRHQSGTKPPSRVRLVGYLGHDDGRRINLKAGRFQTVLPPDSPANVVLTVGTGMNSGKTTTAAKLVKALLRRGARVAACKVTGSVCHRDLFELRSTLPHDVRDFSDYGFPSTYKCPQDELADLFQTMVGDCQRVRPDVIVMEIADGVLQRETRMLLEDNQVRRHVAGVVLAAPCASSALFAIDRIGRFGHRAIAVSGIISNSPLFMREFTDESDVPVGSSVGDASQLASLVLSHCKIATS